MAPGVTLEQANADVARMIPLAADKFPGGARIHLHFFQRGTAVTGERVHLDDRSHHGGNQRQGHHKKPDQNQAEQGRSLQASHIDAIVAPAPIVHLRPGVVDWRHLVGDTFARHHLAVTQRPVAAAAGPRAGGAHEGAPQDHQHVKGQHAPDIFRESA